MLVRPFRPDLSKTIDLYYGNPQNLLPWLTSLQNVLSNEEAERANLFAFEDARLLYQASHGAMRFVIGNQLNIHPKELKFDLGKFGKPFLANSDLYFNLSHSNDLFVISLQENHPIGTDTEPCDRPIQWEQVAKRFYSESEQQLLKKSDTPQKAFHYVWTRKEALLKVLGCGIIDNLNAFDTTHEICQLSNTFVNSLEIDVPVNRYFIKSYIIENNFISIASPVDFETRAIPFKPDQISF
jgi:4'-phosphopantetheinyl transferase